ncbi:MAG: DegQ family serine endoprotease [Thermodesulfovibrionales bacterium]
MSRVRFVASACRILATAALCLAGTGLFAGADVASAEEKRVSAAAKEFLSRLSTALSEIATAASPSVVNISTVTTISMEETPYGELFNDPFFRRFFGDREHPDHPAPGGKFKSAALGSGVIISRDGYILTNLHVVQNADEIKVTLSDKKEFRGKVIGTDPQTDLAVVRIEAKDLPAIRMGRSSALRTGDVVIAIGNPFGLNQTITMGIVSAIGRSDLGITDYEDFIQTDAAVNPGNSGGALVNINGELIGINTAIASTSGGYMGVGFAIPSDMASAVTQSIIRTGKVSRGWMGVSIQDLTPELAKFLNTKEQGGALVTEVMKNSPAEKAGLQRGDLIVAFDGKKVESASSLRNMVGNMAPGKSASLRFLRNGKEMTGSVTLGELAAKKAPEVGKVSSSLMGVEVQDLTPAARERARIPDEVKGVIVVAVNQQSPAQGVLMKNDVITEINRQTVGGLADYERIVSSVGPDSSILLLVYRNGGYSYVTIKK